MRGAPHRARGAALVVGLVVVGLVIFFALRTTSSSTVTAGQVDGGRIAPPIVGRNIMTRAPIDLKVLRGRYVIVDFFASWCGPCIAEEPQVEAFTYAQRNNPRIGFVGVDIDDDAANAHGFLARYGATWPAVTDSGPISEAYGVANPPELFLIDPAGKIVSTIIGQAVTESVLNHWVKAAELAHA